jgi:hypothetical protein
VPLQRQFAAKVFDIVAPKVHQVCKNQIGPIGSAFEKQEGTETGSFWQKKSLVGDSDEVCCGWNLELV